MENLRTNNHEVKLNSSITDVDDLVLGNRQDIKQPIQKGSKLQHAKEQGRLTETDLRSLCEGLNNHINEIGIVMSTAQNYQGTEKVYNFLGKFGIKSAKEKAQILRHDRIQTLSLDNAVKEIENYVKETINQLNESETEYKLDQKLYQSKLDEVLKKNSEATPKYLAAQSKRMQLEAEVAEREEALKSGTISQAERPSKEVEFEAKKRELDAIRLEEKNMLTITKEAKEALPELQKSRDAATQAIQSIHSMRQGMYEKFQNFSVVLSRATTALKAQSRLDLYNNVDPALNKAIESITTNNVATAGAALETWAERMKHAAIDPEASQRLLNELLDHISDAAKDLAAVEENVKTPRRGYSNGLDHDAAEDASNGL